MNKLFRLFNINMCCLRDLGDIDLSDIIECLSSAGLFLHRQHDNWKEGGEEDSMTYHFGNFLLKFLQGLTLVKF